MRSKEGGGGRREGAVLRTLRITSFEARKGERTKEARKDARREKRERQREEEKTMTNVKIPMSNECQMSKVQTHRAPGFAGVSYGLFAISYWVDSGQGGKRGKAGKAEGKLLVPSEILALGEFHGASISYLLLGKEIERNENLKKNQLLVS